MSAIDVTQAIPRRLVYADGQWCLEVQRWAAIDRDVFNPINSYIAGNEAALIYLREICPDPQILGQAQDIVAGPSNSGVSYELEDGQWILQTAFEDQPAPQASSPHIGAAEMEQVMAHMQEMEERLAFLERQLSGRVAGNDSNPSVAPPLYEEAPHSSTG